MNGFTEHQASGASESAGRRDMILTWATAQDMLPLVGHIVGDIRESHHNLQKLRLEKEGLDQRRRTLAWPDRARRYEVGEEITRQEARLHAACEELHALGLTLIDVETGQVGFPTIVNNRRAFFSWRPGEEGVHFWHFAEDQARRTVPPAWKEPSDKVRAGKGNA